MGPPLTHLLRRRLFPGIDSRAPFSVERQHGLGGEAPGYQVLGDLADLPPRPLHADVGRELPLRDQIGEPAEAHRRRLDPKLREKVEAVQRRAPVDEELPRIERDLGGGGDTERDAHGATLEGGQRCAEGPSAHGLDDEVVLGRGRNLVAHHDLVGTELAQRLTSPRLSETARTSTTASPRSGTGSATGRMTSRPGASGSTTTARLSLTGHLRREGVTIRLHQAAARRRPRTGAAW